MNGSREEAFHILAAMRVKSPMQRIEEGERSLYAMKSIPQHSFAAYVPLTPSAMCISG